MPSYVWAVDAYYPTPENGFAVDADYSSLWLATFKTKEEAEEYRDIIISKLNRGN